MYEHYNTGNQCNLQFLYNFTYGIRHTQLQELNIQKVVIKQAVLEQFTVFMNMKIL